jgi:hypothetical protein
MAEEPRMLTPEEIASGLDAIATVVRVELTSLPDSVVNWHPGPEEWCVKEALGHIMEAERRGFAGRIRTILAEDEPDLLGWDQRAVQRERNDCARDLHELVEEFTAMRGDSVGLVRRLSPSDLERGGTHPQVGYVRVNDLLHEWLFHDRNHVRQMLANVQDYVFPLMGNCQKFAGE